MHHATLLTQLFEHLALLIDQHQSLVDRHYGLGNFLEGVMPGLQEECDRLGGRVCDAWWEERNIHRRVSVQGTSSANPGYLDLSILVCLFAYLCLPRQIQESRSYSFTYSASIGETPRSLTKPAQASGPATFSLPGRPSTPASGQTSGASNMTAEPEVDTREVDRVNAEVAAMASRWGTYTLFLTGRLQVGALTAPCPVLVHILILL